jgi:hypothetical protein
MVTQAAERLYTARFQLGLFDLGSQNADIVPVSGSPSDEHLKI